MNKKYPKIHANHHPAVSIAIVVPLMGMQFAPAFQITLDLHRIVVPNVWVAPNVAKTNLALMNVAKILVRAHVETTPFVVLSIIIQYALACQALLVIHFSAVYMKRVRYLHSYDHSLMGDLLSLH